MQSFRRHGFNPWVRKIPLEEEMTTHSSILAVIIPWTKEPSGLQSMGSERVGHDWVTEHTYTHTHCSLCACVLPCFSGARLFADAMDCSPPGSSLHGDSPGKSNGVDCHALLQEIFPTQRSSPSLLHCRWFFTIWATREAQEYWVELPILSPEDLPNPGIELGSPAL